MEVEETNSPLLLTTDELKEEYGGDLLEKIWIESKKIWHIAGPAIFSRFAMFSITVITQAFAGHLSDIDLISITIATLFIITISFGFLLGVASGLETLCGQAYGAKQYQLMGIYLQRSWIVLFFTAILLLPLFIFADPLLRLLGQSNEIAEKAGIVSIWLIPLHFSFAFQFPLQRFLQCQLKNAVIAWVAGFALLLHVFISWLFVYRFNVGLVGTAITLDFSWWVTVLGMYLYMVCGGCPHSWTGFSSQAFSGLWDFFKLSTASGIMLGLENWYYRILIIASASLSSSQVVVNALSICISIYGWESMITLGFFAASGVRVACELGAGNGKAAKFAMKVSLVTSIAVGFFFWLIIMVFNKNLATIFTSTATVVGAVNEFAAFLAFTVLLNCIQPVLSGVAVGSGWQSSVAYINLVSYYIIGTPLGFFLAWSLHLGIKGLWAGLLTGTIVQTVILIFITIRCDWEKQATETSISLYKLRSLKQ
ncbi:protein DETOXIFICATION 27-like [Papaver somniferum]|uniref:protein DETOXIFICATION 27-like n=1 Tax=Papaver somniferum TaxID=3469 RepID=UPI000E6FAA19|nr:protein DETOXIFICATION 27-like [Papaver somniferum]